MNNRSIVVRTLWGLAAILGVLVPSLASVGPVLDHHYAERQPDHQHIFFGPVNHEHTRPYQQPHHHSGAGPEAGPSNGVAALHTIILQ